MLLSIATYDITRRDLIDNFESFFLFGKFLTVPEVFAHSESFYLPVLVIIIKTSQTAGVDEPNLNFSLDGEESNESAFLTSCSKSFHAQSPER